MINSTDGAGSVLVPVARQSSASAAAVRPGLPSARRRDERGMVSAEWAVGIIAAVAIAGVLLTVVTSGPVEKALLAFVLMVIRSFSTGL